MVKTLWSLMDNRRGSVGQALGIIGALDAKDFQITEKNLVYNRFAALPNWLRGRSLFGLTSESQKLISAPYPDYVISISRRTAPVARYIKKMSPKTKLIQLMHPGNTGLEDFDLVIVPEHDRNKKHTANVRYIIGCPHRITPQYLSVAKEKWQDKFAELPKPLTAVIVGGAIKKKPFTEENALALGEAIKGFKQKTGGSILITTSRRTGSEAEKIIMDALKDIPQYTFLWGDTSENPYEGFLACADNIIVTADSVSMCCEATGTGKPVYLFVGSWLTPKHFRFADSLLKNKCAVLLGEAENTSFTPQKSLNAAAEIAEMIKNL